MKCLAVALIVSVLAACGSPPEAPKSPDATAVAAPPAAPAATTATAASPAVTSTPAAPAPSASGPSKSALVDANKIVMSAYPAPFEKTYKAVVAKIGEPQKKSENMNQWFAQDGGKCVLFFMTKDSKKGHAASGISDTDAADCK